MGGRISQTVSTIRDEGYGQRSGVRRTTWEKKLERVAVTRRIQEVRGRNKYI